MTPDFSVLRVRGKKCYAVVSMKFEGVWLVLGQSLPVTRVRESGEWRAKSLVELDAAGRPSRYEEMSARDRILGSMAEIEAKAETSFAAIRGLQHKLEAFFAGDATEAAKLPETPAERHEQR